MAKASETEETKQVRRRYWAALFTTYGLAYAVSCNVYDICDELEEKHPEIYRQKVKAICKKMTGSRATNGTLDDMAYTAKLIRSSKHGIAYLVDFGRAWFDNLKPDFDKLIYAIANELGKFNVPDINLYSKLLVTQTLAADAADATRNKLKSFEGYQVSYGNKTYKITYILKRLSTIDTAHYLTLLVHELLGKYVPKDFDFLSCDAIYNGFSVLYDKINDSSYRDRAIDYTNEQNK